MTRCVLIRFALIGVNILTNHAVNRIDEHFYIPIFIFREYLKLSTTASAAPIAIIRAVIQAYLVIFRSKPQFIPNAALKVASLRLLIILFLHMLLDLDQTLLVVHLSYYKQNRLNGNRHLCG